MGLNIVIIEDEPSIARHLKRILEGFDDGYNILTVISSVEEGLYWLSDENHSYDLIFSDIQLTDGLSFEIFEKTVPRKPIIFITAYEEYTLEAFNTNGIHYVIKPFQKEDIKRALDKYELLMSNNKSSSENHIDQDKLQAIINSFSSMHPKNNKKAYLVHYQNKLIPVKTEEIAWFYTEDEIVYAQVFKGKMYTIGSTLEKIFKEISHADFFRVSRQFIVNRNAIRDIDFYFNGRLIVNVQPSAQEKIIVSKAKVPALKQWIDDSGLNED